MSKVIIKVIKILLMVIGVIWFGFWIVCAFAQVPSQYKFALTLVYLVISLAGLAPIFIFILPKSKTIELQLSKMAFNIDQHIIISSQCEFYVDDKNKKFAVKVGRKLSVFNHIDLLSFELNENGNSIISGKKFKTGTGSMAGSAGSAEVTGDCSSLLVRIMVNNLENPQIVMPFISYRTSRNSEMYVKAYEQAKAVVEILTSVEENIASTN